MENCGEKVRYGITNLWLSQVKSVSGQLLLQGFDFFQRLLTFHGFPIVGEFFCVEGRPFNDESEGAGREFALYYGEGADVDATSVFTVLGVEMRRVVFVIKHADDDTEKNANLRHVFPCYSPAILQMSSL